MINYNSVVTYLDERRNYLIDEAETRRILTKVQSGQVDSVRHIPRYYSVILVTAGELLIRLGTKLKEQQEQSTLPTAVHSLIEG